MRTRPDTALRRRVDALAAAAQGGHGLFADDEVGAAFAVVRRAEERLRHGTDHTVVAIAGATGSGKSSLFNALVGEDIAAVGLKRPTTAHAQAGIFGDSSPPALLDWLDIRKRHGVQSPELDGLVLLDLPDHDSIESGHQLEVDRLVELVDVMVWVLDPQKYADEVLHDRYLAPLASHAGSMVFVLNHADLVPASDRMRWRSHATEILHRDGMADPVVIETSATTGEGVPALRNLLAKHIAERGAALRRLNADVAVAAGGLGSVPQPDRNAAKAADRLAVHLTVASGGKQVGDAVAAGFRFDAARATGWPFTRWVMRFRRHPLQVLRRIPPAEPISAGVPSPATTTSTAQTELAVRTFADVRTGGVPPRWGRRVREIASAEMAQLPAALANRLEQAASTAIKPPRWWSIFGWVQRLLAAAVVAGAVWLALLLLLEYLRVPTEDLTPHIGNWPVPTALLLGGAVAGVVMALFARVPTEIGARRRSRRIKKTLATEMSSVASALVVQPVEEELTRWSQIAADLAIAVDDKQ